MTAQEIFDTVVTHLRKQNCQSGDDYYCLYRGPNGTKCAVGCLIEDEEYIPIMEQRDVYGLYDLGLLPIRLRGSLDLLCALQRVHDEGVVHLEDGLKSVAYRYGLEYSGKPPGEL